MREYAHRGQILSIENQMIPISKDTVFHASYNKNIDGFNQGRRVAPVGPKHALLFDGDSNTYIEIENPLFYQENTEQEWTVAAWVKVDGGGSNTQFLVQGLNLGLRLVNGSSMLLYLNSGTHDYYNYGNKNIQDNVWHHVAFVFKNIDGLKNIYVDGIDITRTSGPNKTSRPSGMDSTLKIGSSVNGSIAQFKIWNKALLPHEVQGCMYYSDNERDESLICDIEMNERDGVFSSNKSIMGNDGIWNGNISPSKGLVYEKIEKGRFENAALIEPSTKNLFLNPKVREDAKFWTPTTTIEDYGDYIKLSHSSKYGGISQSPNIIIGTSYVISYYIKVISGSLYCGGHITNGSNIKIRFDKGPWTEGTSLALPEHNKWFFIEEAFTANSSGVARQYVQPGRGEEINTVSHIRTGKDYGIQMEEGVVASSFTEGERPNGTIGYPPHLIDWTQPWTVSMWTKFSQTAELENRSCVLWGAQHRPVKNEGLHILRRSSDSISIAFTGNDLDVSEYNKDTEWHHYSFVWDGVYQIIYEDGKEIGRRESDGKLSYKVNEVIHGPGLHTNDMQSPNALIDEVRIEQRAIKEDEAKAWASSGAHYNYLDYTLGDN